MRSHLTTNIRKNKYFFLIVDNFSKLLWVVLLKSKLEAFDTFKRFKTIVEAEIEVENLSKMSSTIIVIFMGSRGKK